MFSTSRIPIREGDTDACLVFHEDQYRGLKYSFNDDSSDGKYYHEPSPDYFKLVYRGGKGSPPDQSWNRLRQASDWQMPW